MKELEKLGQRQVAKVTLHFVWGHLTRKQTVADVISRVFAQRGGSKNIKIAVLL